MSSGTPRKIFFLVNACLGFFALGWAFWHFDSSKIGEIVILASLIALAWLFMVDLPRKNILFQSSSAIQLLSALTLGAMAPIPWFLGSFYRNFRFLKERTMSFPAFLNNIASGSFSALVIALAYESCGGSSFAKFSQIKILPVMCAIATCISLEMIYDYVGHHLLTHRKDCALWVLPPFEVLLDLGSVVLAIPAYLVYTNFGFLGLVGLTLPFTGWFALCRFVVTEISEKRDIYLLSQLTNEVISSNLDFQAMAGRTLSKLRSLLEVDGVELFLKEEGSWTLKGIDGKSPWEFATPTKQFLMEIENIFPDLPGFFDEPPYRTGFKSYVDAGLPSLLIIPLVSVNESIGFVICAHHMPCWFEFTYNDLGATLSTQLGKAFAAATAHGRLVTTLTELQRAKAELVQLEKMAGLGQLVAGVAHEMNSPLNAMFITAPAMRELYSGKLPFEDRANFEKMGTNLELSVKKLSGIVKNLEIFGKAQASKETWKDVSIKQVVETSLETLRAQYADRVEVHVCVDDEVRIWCNSSQIEQLVKHVLLNGFQAIRGKGEVWIEARNLDDKLMVTIRDSGSGIPREIQNRIFEPFFTTREIGDGTGLGLSVAYGIMRAHSGEIRVESEIAKGTTVTLTFPMVKVIQEALKADFGSVPQVELLPAG